MGGAASGRKGSAYERECVDYFRENGWGALRLGASGSGGDADLPDVLAGRPAPLATGLSELLAVECKSGKATTLYADEEEVEALEAFADAWGAAPYLGARSTQQATDTRHYLIKPPLARRTDSAFGLPVAELDERASVVVGPEGVEQR